MCNVEVGEYVAARMGPSGKLNEKRRKKIVELLLIEISEVEVIVGQQGLLSISQGYNILYDRRTVNNGVNRTNVDKSKKDKPEDTLA